MSLGLFGSQPNVNKQFVRMKGPGGKGYAEMAVEKCDLPKQVKILWFYSRQQKLATNLDW